MKKHCTVSGCSGIYYAKGFCKRHYYHNHLYGDPLVYKKGFSVEEKFWSKAVKTEGCWRWDGYKNNNGYGHLSIKINDSWKSEGAHRVSWRIHYGEIPEGQCVLHKCDNPECTNPEHLFLGTQQDNLADMCEKGRNYSHPVTKLSCGHTGRRHQARGMCNQCYMNWWRGNKMEAFK